MSIPVKALRTGFYGNKLRYEDECFEVKSVLELGTWMERQDDGPNKGEEGFQALFDAAVAARDKKAAKAAPQGRSRRAAQEPPPPPSKEGDEDGTTSDQDVI